jgi:hypothetical protein
VVSPAGGADGLLLVAVEAQRPPRVPATSLLLVPAEDATTLRMKYGDFLTTRGNEGGPMDN